MKTFYVEVEITVRHDQQWGEDEGGNLELSYAQVLASENHATAMQFVADQVPRQVRERIQKGAAT